MPESFLTSTLPLSMSIATPDLPASPLAIVLAAAPDKAAPGLPGRQTGDILLVSQDARSNLVVSLGKKEKISSDTFRQAAGAVGKWLRQSGADKVDLEASQFEAFTQAGALDAFLEGLLLGAYQFNLHKKTEDPQNPMTVFLRAPQTAALGSTVARISTVVSAIYLARDWSHEPANIINPITLAERVVALAAASGLKCTVLDHTTLAEMGAGAIVNVGKGSKTPSRMIILEYLGTGSAAAARPVVLVGKALTFDSGGYSLKGVENIVGMKYDKCGGVTVAATLMAAAALKLKTPLVGVIAAAENLVSGEAYRPDDIITTLSGKTIEIISTDAEGRLVLADALTYAQRQFNPLAMIDLATLTGGVVTALGRVRAGLMSNNDALASQLFNAGETTAERLWRLPLDEEYFKQIKGDDADIKNSGGREAHPIIGGIFLKQFVDDAVPWAHLDIAGVADIPRDFPYAPKGATGFGIRLLLEYISNL